MRLSARRLIDGGSMGGQVLTISASRRRWIDGWTGLNNIGLAQMRSESRYLRRPVIGQPLLLFLLRSQYGIHAELVPPASASGSACRVLR